MKEFIKRALLGKKLSVLNGNLRGLKLQVSPLLKSSIFFRNYEAGKQKVLKKLVRENSFFFDVGANIGIHSYWVSRMLPSATVYSFEPLPENAAFIRQTIADNGLTNIIVCEQAVSAKSGFAYFDRSKDNSQGLLSEKQTALKVEVISLDDFTETRSLIPEVIKIDVEGFESEVLAGADRLIREHKPSLVIELHNPEQDRKVWELLTHNDYAIFRIDDSGQLILVSDAHDSWGDILAVHRSKRRNYAI